MCPADLDGGNAGIGKTEASEFALILEKDVLNFFLHLGESYVVVEAE